MFRFARLDGTMAQKDREKVLREFSEATKTCIMLVSIKTAGVGLNLTKANRGTSMSVAH